MALCLELGKTLGELRRTITAAELPLWAAYRALFGFPSDRIAGGVAMAGAATASAFGGKVQARDLIPRYEADRDQDDVSDRLMAWALSTKTNGG